MTEAVLHLVSSSPRRREILLSLGLTHSYAGVDIDESAQPGEAANKFVMRLAEQKATAASEHQSAGLPVLGADTIVVVDEQIFGKPSSAAHAMAMLSALSGRSHQVMTAIALRIDKTIRSDLCISEVTFRNVSPDEARAYWQSGEPAGKAGAYAVQGCGGIFVQRVRGSYSGVVGLPVFETAALLNFAGINVLPELKPS